LVEEPKGDDFVNERKKPHSSAVPETDILSKQSREAGSDVLGSYTGTPADRDDIPEQDADDL